VDILSCGADVTVTSKQTGWYRVRTQDGKEGYVKETFLAVTSPAEQAIRHVKDGYINCDPEANGVHLYESTEALRAIMMVHCGEKIAVLEEIQREHGNWDKIETSGGSVGYLFSGFVSSNPPTVDAGALEAQYKTCAKHSIPADNCTLEVYYQLRDKDEPQGAAAAQGLVDVAGVNQAIQGTIMMRDGVRDPTSFTVLQVLLEPNGGCVHYVASNAFGGRVQQWGVYSMDKKGRITVALNLQFQYYIDWCVKSSWRDVTAEVKKAISQGDGR